MCACVFVCVCLCERTSHDYPSLVEGESHGLLLLYLVFDRRHFDYIVSRTKKVPFSVAIENGELIHDCFPKHSRMGTARMK